LACQKACYGTRKRRFRWQVVLEEEGRGDCGAESWREKVEVFVNSTPNEGARRIRTRDGTMKWKEWEKETPLQR